MLIPDGAYAALLRGAAAAARAAKPGYVGYAASHLSLQERDIADAEQLGRAIDRRLSLPRPAHHVSGVIDYAPRPVGDILKHGRPLPPDAVQAMRDAVVPLIPKALEIQLVERHSRPPAGARLGSARNGP